MTAQVIGPEPVAVVGAGLIGAGWAAVFTAAGLEVRAWDPDPERLSSLRERVRPLRRALSKLRPVRRGRLAPVRSLDAAVAGVRLVQENAPEDLAAKRVLLTAIEAAADPATVIASSTSALLWSDLAQEMVRPERLLVAHPFNPVHLIPLVELFTPDPALAEHAMAFYTALGKRPVRLRREVPGHIAGRLAAALWREAVHLAGEGVASVADIDTALIEGPGLRWAVQGAHLSYHLGGGAGGIADYLEHLGPSQERRWATLGEPRLDAGTRQLLIAGVAEEAAGRSTGELAAARDAALIRLVRARRKAEGAG